MSKPLLSTLVFCLALLAATLAIYLPGLGNALVFDDQRLADGTVFGSYGALWPLQSRALSYGSFVWVAELFGQGWWKQRLLNVVLHLGVAAAVYGLLRELLRSLKLPDDSALSSDPADQRAALRIAVAVFALNPVAVYAVAYLVQRSIVLAALFTALGLLAFVRGLHTRRPGWFAAAVAAYVLAVLSKETAVMAVALALPVFVFVRRPPARAVGLGVAGMAVVLGLATAALYPMFGAILGKAFDVDSIRYVQQLEALRPGVSQKVFPLSVLNEAFLFFRYGLLWMLPNMQWMSIDLRPAFPLDFFSVQAVGALAFVALFAACVWGVLRRSDAWGFAALCVLCPMLLYFTEFATVWLQDPFVLYRSYLWALTLPGVLVLGLLALPRRLVYQGGILVCALLAGLAYERQTSFRDSYTVWADAVEKIDTKAQANAVGRWRPYLNRGSHFLDREMLEQAYADFARAEALGETQGAAPFSRGVVLQLLKRHPEALAAFDQAAALGFQEAALFYHRGESQFAQGKLPQALESYAAALQRKQAPEVQRHTRLRRAEAAVSARQYDLAIAEFKALVAARPQDTRALTGLGLAYVGQEKAAEAMAVFDQLLAAGPSAVGYYGRAMAQVVGANKAAGLVDLDRAIALDPQNEMYKSVRSRIVAQK